MAASDPKTNRTLGQTSNRGDVESDEDPLVELARIVSEDSGFSSGRTEKKAARNDAANDALADDLEAELLQELESSFAARETPPPANLRPLPAARGNAALPPPPPPPREEEADPDELLRSIEQQLSQFERRQAGRFGSTTTPLGVEPEDIQSPEEADEPAEDAPEELPFGAPANLAEATEAWQGRRPGRIRPISEDLEPAAEAEEESEPLAEPPPAPRTEYRFRGPAGAEWDRQRARREEPESAPSEPEVVAPPAPPRAAKGPRRISSDEGFSANLPRRERVQAPFPEFEEEPAAERAAPDLSSVEGSLSREFRPQFSGATPSDKWQDGDASPEESRIAAAIAPGPSRRAAAARAAAAHRGRSRIGLFLAALIVVGVIGGGAAFYLRSSESTPSGPPPLITAEPGAVRVEASSEQQSQAGSGETVGDAVYNRVAGTSPTTEERVVDNSEEPREVARIVLPPSASSDNVVSPVGEDGTADAAADQRPADAAGSTAPAPPAAAEPTAPAASAATEEAIGPRRVPTFVVKSDGSIVATSEAGSAAPDPTAVQEQQLTSETEPIEPVRVPTVAIAEAAAPSNADAGSPPVPAPPTATEEVAPPETPPPPAPIDEPPPEVVEAAPPVAPAPAEAPASGAIEEPADAAVAATEPATEAPPAPSVSGGGFFVQLSSEGSMEDGQSAYARSRQRFPSVLGNLEPQIQRADLGAKGVFYRVRVGPWATRPEAIQVCESLKAAGGSCFVAK